MHLRYRNCNDAFRGLVNIFHRADGEFGFNVPGELNRIVPMVKRPSRQGNVLVIDEPVTITYTHPRERVLFNQARDVNPFWLVYEQLWMLAGRNDVAPLAYYNSKIVEIASDDGKTFNGAYGYRWRKAPVDTVRMGFYNFIDQLDLLVNHLKADPNSRRAVLQMWNVEDDLLKIGCSRGTECKTHTSKDVCCNLSVMFSIRQDHCPGCYEGGLTGEPDGYAVHIEHQEWGHYDRTEDYPKKPRCRLCKGSRKAPTKLDITVTNRSNDLVWGMLGSDYVTFTILQEYMAARLGCEVGVYHHFTSNLHVYDWNWFPDKWLNSPAADENIYDVLMKSFIPLVKDPAAFERELPVIINAFSNSTGGSYTTSTEPFLDDVAKPMFQAFRYHKTNNPICALEECKFIKADDWRIVATNWLTKRSKK